MQKARIKNCNIQRAALRRTLSRNTDSLPTDISASPLDGRHAHYYQLAVRKKSRSRRRPLLCFVFARLREGLASVSQSVHSIQLLRVA